MLLTVIDLKKKKKEERIPHTLITGFRIRFYLLNKRPERYVKYHQTFCSPVYFCLVMETINFADTKYVAKLSSSLDI